ncbi:unnamed protein product [Toxocara canis]|uniref:WD_REPEATS_REGION domain-containing protein n=1 Tax=Toxocara canis TaxID=6265 RepID=A0A183UIM4_TOXCA|nr:unnamed protein product [Toxocara canis]
MDDSSGTIEGRNVGGANKSFMLSRIIAAHAGDVKGVSETSAGLIVTGSRDGSVKTFLLREGNYSEVLSIEQPQKIAVNALAVYESCNGWLLFVGRKDGSVAVFASDRTEPLRTLRKHQLNVCALHVDPVNKILISGSWDSKAVVWPITEIVDNKEFNFEPFSLIADSMRSVPVLTCFPLQAFELVAHKMSVWAVASCVDMPGYYLTGSADMTIKFWKGDSELITFSGHRDVVRCITVISSRRFLSASNDSTIRLWDLVDKCCVHSYSSQPGEYIYNMSLFCMDGGRMLTNCGESGFVELWDVGNEGELRHSQILHTPAYSIWCLCALLNGDIAAGADDGSVYVFTRDASRKATSAQFEILEAGITKKIAEMETARATQGRAHSIFPILFCVVKFKDFQEVVKINVTLEHGQGNMVLTYKKGTDPADAAQAFITENNLSPAYLDEIVEYMKANIPELRSSNSGQVLGSGPSRPELGDGSQWDYTFNVNTEDGRTLKLQYNVGEDTNWAAQRFVEKYNLPVKFLPKISALLQAQLPGLSVCENSGSFVDPLTGEGRYVPGAESANVGWRAIDPLTGEGRYVPSATNDAALMPNACLPHDRKRPRGELVPLREYFRFGIEQTSSKAITTLKEFNKIQCDHRLTEQQVKALEEVMNHSTFEVRDVHVAAFDAGLQWSTDTILPIVDAFRLALLNRQLNKIYCSIKREEGREPRGTMALSRLTALLIDSTSDAVRVLSCRAIANAAVHEWGRHMLMDDLGTNISALLSQLSSHKSALQFAACSALANLALLLLKHTESGHIAELGPREDMILLVIKTLGETQNFGDFTEGAQIRLLQTVATLMWGDDALIKLAKARNIVAIANRMKDAVVNEAGKTIARDIVEMAYAV